MRFSFNVQFQKWLKTNTGKTYKDAITAYYEILEEKKNKKNIYKNIAKKKLQDFPLLFARKEKNKGKVQITQMLMGGKACNYWKAKKIHEKF